MYGKKFGLVRAFSLLALISAAAEAQDFSPEAIEKANPYKDLPGVKDPAKSKAEDAAGADRCWTEIRMAGERMFGARGDRAPVLVYICERNGVTVESTEPPRKPAWDQMGEP